MHLRLIVNNGVLNRKSEHPRKTFVWAFFFIVPEKLRWIGGFSRQFFFQNCPIILFQSTKHTTPTKI